MVYVVVFLILISIICLSLCVYFYMKNKNIMQKNNILISNIKLNEERISIFENDIDSLNQEIKSLIEQNANLKTSLEYEKKINQEKLDEFKNLKEQTKNEFKVLSQSILEERIKAHKMSQEENLSNILKPFQTQIDNFKKRVEEVYDKETKGRSELFSEIKHLRNLNDRISQDAINLTNALKGNNKIQGNWGEVILENLLQDSGLIKDREYVLQQTHKNEKGSYSRPDVIIKLPNNKKIIIDSKVSLIDYERYINKGGLVNSNDKNDDLFLHITSIKNHIKNLSNKNYNDLLDGSKLDFVLMFIPLEGAFLDAIKYDSELFLYAYNKNIILVSPTTLYATLRTIENIWRNERQNNNMEEILKTASGLYDKFLIFYEGLESLGKNLQNAEDNYKTSLNRLKDGRGSIVSQIQKLEELGVKGKRKIPKEL
ncbi:hypothetical protein CCY99_02875 [Helicobacter sp. 16-1353]|uniref:DNA recombination protein RmuC n=1 Tax=Helicobacter sp. 16-1353 TaxID=2004996 RepID=UPI000DCDAE97|nr:DNA recombination protein RmuC [Helicobacter sp. 16-1353]RAX54719.1 hypothetical protein CCY99_02875 [Helicobacter sp. 16-1353]